MTPPAGETSVRIRPAEAADADAVIALVRELNQHEGNPIEAFTREVFLTDGCGEHAAFAFLLAEEGGDAVGYAVCVPAYDSGFALRGVYVADLFVRPPARRRGIGRALLAAVARGTRATGGGYLWLTARTDNTAAHAFYRTLATVEQTVVAFGIAGPDLDHLAAG